jgi:hypothetical protein
MWERSHRSLTDVALTQIEIRMPKSPPNWIRELANSAALQICPADLISPIGCHFFQADGMWEVTLFASKTEVVGGSHDGRRCDSRFSVDIQAVCRLLSQIERVEWQAHPFAPDDELGAHLAVTGRFGKHQVCLRILAIPPERFEPGRRAVTYIPAWEEVW